jgi:hypothetical protein
VVFVVIMMFGLFVVLVMDRVSFVGPVVIN